MKNPAVDTSFLPDREREERERIEREELRKEWLARQDKMKNETIEITYSYWDGSGHRKSVEVSSLCRSLPCSGMLKLGIYSVRRVTILRHFWRNAELSSRSSGASVWIILCISRYATGSCRPARPLD